MKLSLLTSYSIKKREEFNFLKNKGLKANQRNENGSKVPRPGVEQFSSIKGQKYLQALRPYSLCHSCSILSLKSESHLLRTLQLEFDHGPRNQKCYHVYKELINIRQK